MLAISEMETPVTLKTAVGLLETPVPEVTTLVVRPVMLAPLVRKSE